MTEPQTSMMTLTAKDGHTFDAYQATPTTAIRGAIVVVQEIFGVNAHIQAVTRQYAAEGYLAIAPALFDRVERHADIPYGESARGAALMRQLDTQAALLDLSATVASVAPGIPVGMVGYCWGGRLTYLSACSLPIKAGVAYYGGGIGAVLPTLPACPMMFHYGERDTHIPLSEVAAIQSAFPAGSYYIYPAEHGFNCSERPAYDPASAALAFARTREFFSIHLQ